MKTSMRFLFDYSFVIVTVSCLISINTLAHEVQLNRLKRVNHQIEDDKSVTIDLGSVAFYFKNEQTVNVIPTNSDRQIVFFFPLAVILNEEVEDAIKNINRSDRTFYSIKIEQVEAPIKGIRLLINYDVDMVYVKSEKYQSLSRNMGIIFQFYNRGLIKQIERKESGLLSVI